MQLIETKSQATDVVSQDVAPFEVSTDARRYSRLGWLIVLAGVGGFLLWALLAPLDKGVPLQGFVAKESNHKTVQHLSGGTVDQILVKDGDVVKAGQVLVRMNAVNARAQYDATDAQYVTDRAMEARLIAERDGVSHISFPEALLKRRGEPHVSEVMELQSQLLMSRQGSLRNELAGVDENIAGLKIQIKGLQESRQSKKEQMDILKEQLGGMRDLAKEGYVARNRLLDLERTYAQLSGALSEDIGNIGRAQSQVMELGLRRSQRMQDYQKEVRTTLTDVSREAESLEARREAQKFELDNVEVRAPVDGTVVNLAVFTRGGVVGTGAKLMDIVPSNDPLVVEGSLPVNLVDKVHQGLKVELMFVAFNSNRTPHIEGEVETVAADRTLDERSGQAFYKVRVRVTPKGQKTIAEHQLRIIPGMPVEVFVKTGERTMMNYLLKPVFDRTKSSMSEE
jgi:membrane fusion protein, protease secretion system